MFPFIPSNSSPVITSRMSFAIVVIKPIIPITSWRSPTLSDPESPQVVILLWGRDRWGQVSFLPAGSVELSRHRPHAQ